MFHQSELMILSQVMGKENRRMKKEVFDFSFLVES